MSQKVIGVIEEVVKTVSIITKKRDWPALPIDRNPPRGDFAIICFPAAKILKKDPSWIAIEIGKDLLDNDWVYRLEQRKVTAM